MRQSPLLRLKRQVASPPRPKFQTASRLRFDDSLAINIGERVVGECSSTLVDKLCITALLPERRWIWTPHVLTLGINQTFINV